MLNGKTGMRRVRVIDCVPDVKTWLNNHPRGKDPSAPLFLELRGKFNHLGNHATLANILKAVKRRAGLNKRVYPHLFRHSRATHLAKDFTEQELKVIFGWSGGSRMPATYVHLSGADVDKKMLEKRGLLEKNNGNAKAVLEPIMCRNCHFQNSTTARLCTKCSHSLIPGVFGQSENGNLLNQLFKDGEFRELFIRKLGELNLSEQVSLA